MTDTDPGKHLIVIVGCPRSGTTLLRTMLGNHPAIHAHPDEPQFVLGLYQRFGINIRDVKAAIDYVAGHPYFPASLDKDLFRKEFAGTEPLTLREFIDKYLIAWGTGRPKSSCLVIKHPELVFHLKLIDQLFPHSTLLHIVRDPRSTVLSNRNRWPQFSVWESAMLWKKAVQMAKSWGMRHSNRYQEVSYEQLVQEPDTALSRLLKNLGLPFSDQVLTFEHKSTVYSDGRPVEIIPYNQPDPARIHLWETHLTPLEVRKIEYCCKSQMHHWGYEPQAPPVSRWLFVVSLFFDHVRHVFLLPGRWLKSVLRQFGWRFGFLAR